MEKCCKVLLADANEGFRSLLADQLERAEGFTVAGAVGDGREALRMVRETSPDLLVTDVILPGLDGLSLLKQLPKEGRPKIIVLLGSTAGKNVLGESFRVARDRGVWIEKKGVWIMPTYHPSALLRDETLKRPAWEDFKAIRDKARALKEG